MSVVTLTGPRHPPKSGTSTDSLIVLLHGIGASGDDLIGLADAWADALPHTVFHSPNAPLHFDDAPFGYQWYSRRTDQSRVSGLYEVEGTVNAYVDDLLARYELAPARCVLVGFSQGSIVSLHVAPRRKEALGGVVSFSGRMVTADTLREELANRTPICLVHGAEDPVLPSEGTVEGAATLSELDVPHELHILPGLGHAIDARGLEKASQFIQGVLEGS